MIHDHPLNLCMGEYGLCDHYNDPPPGVACKEGTCEPIWVLPSPPAGK